MSSLGVTEHVINIVQHCVFLLVTVCLVKECVQNWINKLRYQYNYLEFIDSGMNYQIITNCFTMILNILRFVKSNRY